MRKIIGIGGMPLTGKTALVRSVMATLGRYDSFQSGFCEGRVYGDADVIVLGAYPLGSPVGGSDHIRHAFDSSTSFITAAMSERKYSEHTILFEGDRLFTTKFYCWCKYAGLKRSFYFLSTAPSLYLVRDKRRFEQYEPEHLAIKRSKYLNMAKSPSFKVLINDDLTDQARNTEVILSELFKA